MRLLESRLDDWRQRANAGPDAARAAATWHRLLDETRRTRFLQALGSRDARHRWAEAVFMAVGASASSGGSPGGPPLRASPPSRAS